MLYILEKAVDSVTEFRCTDLYGVNSVRIDCLMFTVHFDMLLILAQCVDFLCEHFVTIDAAY